MRQLLRHSANATLPLRSSNGQKCVLRIAACAQIQRDAATSFGPTKDARCGPPSLVVIYDGAAVVKNTIAAVRDTGQTRMGCLRAAEE